CYAAAYFVRGTVCSMRGGLAAGGDGRLQVAIRSVSDGGSVPIRAVRAWAGGDGRGCAGKRSLPGTVSECWPGGRGADGAGVGHVTRLLASLAVLMVGGGWGAGAGGVGVYRWGSAPCQRERLGGGDAEARNCVPPSGTSSACLLRRVAPPPRPLFCLRLPVG